jgi:hypothetical protein
MQPSLEPDPIAELARLIGQADPHGRGAPAENRFHEQTAPDGDDGPPVLPLALVALTEFEHAHERNEHYRDGRPFDFEEQSCPPARGTRMKFRARAFATRPLCWRYAVLRCWAAGAIGYREVFGGSVIPSNEPVRSSPRLASRKPKTATAEAGSVQRRAQSMKWSRAKSSPSQLNHRN